MMKIRLESDAIKALIEKAPEVLLEIKKGVVANFMKSAIKPMLNYKELNNEIQQCREVEKELKVAHSRLLYKQIEKALYVSAPLRYDRKLKPAIKKLLAEESTKQMDNILANAVQIEVERLRPFIADVIADKVQHRLSELVKEELKKRLAALE